MSVDLSVQRWQKVRKKFLALLGSLPSFNSNGSEAQGSSSSSAASWIASRTPVDVAASEYVVMVNSTPFQTTTPMALVDEMAAVGQLDAFFASKRCFFSVAQFTEPMKLPPSAVLLPNVCDTAFALPTKCTESELLFCVALSQADGRKLAAFVNPESTTCPGNSFASLRGSDTASVVCPVAPATISGLHLITNFISSAEEADLLQTVTGEGMVWHKLARRRVAHLNRCFNYETEFAESTGGDGSSFGGKIPANIAALHERLVSGETPGWPAAGLDVDCDQITVNEYDAEGGRSGIAHHIDSTNFGNVVFSLSLNAHTVMEFKHVERPAVLQVLLPPRSLLIMAGEARYEWTHSITEQKLDVIAEKCVALRRDLRYSITFRRAVGH